MITKREFIAAVQQYERVAARWAKIMGLFLAISIFALAGLDYAKTHGPLTWLGTTEPAAVFGPLWLVATFGMLGVFLARQYRCRVTCPHCKKQLVQFSARIVIATGVCSFCGEKIFEQSFQQA